MTTKTLDGWQRKALEREATRRRRTADRGCDAVAASGGATVGIWLDYFIADLIEAKLEGVQE